MCPVSARGVDRPVGSLVDGGSAIHFRRGWDSERLGAEQPSVRPVPKEGRRVGGILWQEASAVVGSHHAVLRVQEQITSLEVTRVEIGDPTQVKVRAGFSGAAIEPWAIAGALGSRRTRRAAELILVGSNLGRAAEDALADADTMSDDPTSYWLLNIRRKSKLSEIDLPLPARENPFDPSCGPTGPE